MSSQPGNSPRWKKLVRIAVILLLLTITLPYAYYSLFYYNSYGVSRSETQPQFASSPAVSVGDYDFETVLYRDAAYNSVALTHLADLRYHLMNRHKPGPIGYASHLSATLPIRLIKGSIKIEHRLTKNGPPLTPLKITDKVDANHPRNNYSVTYAPMILPKTIYEHVVFEVLIDGKRHRVDRSYVLHHKPYYNTLEVPI